MTIENVNTELTDEDVAAYWNQNATAWTAMARAGNDVCRDAYNTPTFLAMLPDVAGLSGLDVGCRADSDVPHPAGSQRAVIRGAIAA